MAAEVSITSIVIEIMFLLKIKYMRIKAALLNKSFACWNLYFLERNRFDQVVFYEDFIREHHGYKCKRSVAQILRFNARHSKWCRDNPVAEGTSGGGGGGGVRSNIIQANVHVKRVNREERAIVEKFCPELSLFYKRKKNETNTVR